MDLLTGKWVQQAMRQKGPSSSGLCRQAQLRYADVPLMNAATRFGLSGACTDEVSRLGDAPNRHSSHWSR